MTESRMGDSRRESHAPESKMAVQSKIGDVRSKETDKQKMPNSSIDEDDEWLTLFKKNEFVQKQYFIDDTKFLNSYIETMHGLTRAVAALLITVPTEFRINVQKPSDDELAPICTKSVYESLKNHMTKLKEVINDDSRKHIAEQFSTLFGELSDSEMKFYKHAKNADKNDSFFDTCSDYERLVKLDKNIQSSLIKCCKRRRRIEMALILPDLREQGHKYTKDIEKLDSNCIEMCKYHATLMNSIIKHFKQLKVVLPLICESKSKQVSIVEKFPKII